MGGFGMVMTINGYKLTAFKWATEIPLLHVSEGLRALPIMLSGIFIFLYSVGHLIHFFSDTNQEETK
jgi:TRAP-type C4-dicarboxylate transport system permease small subunit